MNIRLATIADYVESVTTWNPTTKPQESFVYIDLSAVDQTEKQITSAASVVGSEAPSRARQLVKEGDILVSTVRPNLNGAAPVSEVFDGATASTGFCVLRPRPEKLSSNYLMHWVRSPQFVELMVRQATGASYPAVSDRIVKGSPIPLPSLDEQRRIAAILDKADELRRKRKLTLDLLDSLTQSIFLEMFGRSSKLDTKPLADFVDQSDRINYGVVQPGDEVSDGVNLVRVSDLKNGIVNHTKLRRVSQAISDKHGRSLLRGNEILISCVGSIGEIAIATAREKGFNIARAVARVPIVDDLLRAFVAEYLRSPIVQEYFVKELRTVSQPTLNIKQISETQIPMPPVAKLQKFLERRDAVRRNVQAARTYVANSDTMFSSLQSRAFSGEL